MAKPKKPEHAQGIPPRKRPEFVRNPPPLVLKKPPVSNVQDKEPVRPHLGYGHYFFQPAEAYFHNILALRRAFQQRRALLLTVTMSRDDIGPPEEIRRRVRQYFSNYISRNQKIVAWARVMGRGRRSLHWHCVIITKKPQTRTSGRLRTLRKELKAAQGNLGRIQLQEIQHLGATARYLANHIERNLRAKSSLRQRKLPIPAELTLRLYDYSHSLRKIVKPREKSTHPWTEAFREAAAEIWAEEKWRGKPTPHWMFRNARKIRARIGAILERHGLRHVMQVVAPKPYTPSHTNEPGWWERRKKPKEPRGPLAIWDVYRLPEGDIWSTSPSYMLLRRAIGEERFVEADPKGGILGRQHKTVPIYLSKTEFLRIVRLQPRAFRLALWLDPPVDI